MNWIIGFRIKAEYYLNSLYFLYFRTAVHTAGDTQVLCTVPNW